MPLANKEKSQNFKKIPKQSYIILHELISWFQFLKILNVLLQMNIDLRNCNLRKNIDLRKIVPTTKILVYKWFDLRKIFKP